MPPRAHAICRRCGLARDAHPTNLCADGRGFLAHQNGGVSNSFTVDQARLLDQLLKGLLSGRDVTGLVRHAAFPGLAAKATRMVDRLKGRP